MSDNIYTIGNDEIDRSPDIGRRVQRKSDGKVLLVTNTYGVDSGGKVSNTYLSTVTSGNGTYLVGVNGKLTNTEYRNYDEEA